MALAIPATCAVVRGPWSSWKQRAARGAIALAWALSFAWWILPIVWAVDHGLDLIPSSQASANAMSLWLAGTTLIAGALTAGLLMWLARSRVVGAGIGGATAVAAVWYLVQGGTDRVPPVIWHGVVSAVLLWWALRPSPDPNACPGCSYALVGLSTDRCPECGRAL
jgi:hypothetical protein